MAQQGLFDLSGRLALVTGASRGIGLALARGLAQAGARVVIVGRNPEKCTAAVRRLHEATGVSGVEWLACDLASLHDVRQLASEFTERYPRLDVLVNNAGAIFMKRQLSIDGIEMTLAVNHLAPFLLTNLLLDVLVASAPARIVNVSSVAHEHVTIDFDNLHSRGLYRPMKAYGKSKLANVLFTYELARRMEGTNITANALHPGLVRTSISTSAGRLSAFGERLVHLIWRSHIVSADKGAETIVHLAASPSVEGVSGKYFVDKRAVPSSDSSYDVDVAKRLWDVSSALTGLSLTR